MTLGALGIVFGDIGTSPLYALRECFNPERGVALTPDNIVGIVSLLLWSLGLLVGVKYLAFVLRADNHGEGGILALVALVSAYLKSAKSRTIFFLSILGILGAALIYSDGIITPSISILSAIEGLENVSSNFQPWIVPLAIAVLLVLFPLQARGTGSMGKLFGPIIALWFIVIGLLGLLEIIRQPAILLALNPLSALGFVVRNPSLAFVILGAVFLSLTGAEVLYADLGHFGKKPIRCAWFGLVFPALVLNYAGQGAFLLSGTANFDNLFFQIAPAWSLYPMVILSTAATIIASQAVISGAFSLARQSIQLGFWPRMRVTHTSRDTVGQVYVPAVNIALAIGTLILILVFRESAKLADAYGIAVSATMIITTCLMIYVAWKIWKTPPFIWIPIAVLFSCIDLAYFLSNATKFLTGGWLITSIALVLFVLMFTWLQGRKKVRTSLETFNLPLPSFLEILEQAPPPRIKGTGIFLSGNPSIVPMALLHNLKHNKILHENIFMVSAITEDIPLVPDPLKAAVEYLGNHFWRVTLHFGFSETPDIPAELSNLHIPCINLKAESLTYFVGREIFVDKDNEHIRKYNFKQLFLFMSRNASEASAFFGLPQDQLVIVGTTIEL